MSVLSERAEASRNSANRALAHYRLELSDFSRLGSRVAQREVGEGAQSVDVVHSHDAILRLVAIAEDYSINRLIDVTERKLPPDPLTEMLWNSELERSSDTWDARFRLWNRLHGVKATAFASRDTLQAFVEARNTITHGLGELTRKQRRDRRKTASRLAHAGIELHGDRIVLTEGHVEHCADVVKAFIQWLDEAA